MRIGHAGASRLVSLGLMTAVVTGWATFAAPAAGAATVTLQVASWLPAWDAATGGGWGLVPTGTMPGPWTAFSGSAKALSVAAGRYDAYWVQNKTLPPMLVGTGIDVDAAGATVSVLTGVQLAVADWARVDATATWVAMAAQQGGNVSIVGASQSGAMMLAPGEYDVYWKESADAAYGWVQNVIVAPPSGTLGLQVDLRPEGVHVVTVGAGGAGARAGLRADDIITSIDGKSVVGLDTDSTVALLRGAPGTIVRLVVARLGATPISLTRVLQTPVTIRIDSGIKLAAGQTLAMAPAMGWWGAVFAGDDPAQSAPVNRTGKPAQPVHSPPGTYDVYWSADGKGAPTRLASGVVVEAGRVTEVVAKR